MKPKEVKSIVILHGWGADSGRFTEVRKLLEKQGYKVYTPDLPGFGESQIPAKPLKLSDYVSFLENYISGKKISSFILIGHSFGGRIAIKYASQNPKELHALVLAAASGIKHFSLKAVVFKPIAKVGRFFLGNNEKFRQLFYKVVRENDYYKANAIMRQTMANTLKEDIKPYLPKIKVPTLIIWGKNDKFVPVKDAYTMHKLVSNSKLTVIKNEGHLFPYQKPKEFIEIIKTYVN